MLRTYTYKCYVSVSTFPHTKHFVTCCRNKQQLWLASSKRYAESPGCMSSIHKHPWRNSTCPKGNVHKFMPIHASTFDCIYVADACIMLYPRLNVHKANTLASFSRECNEPCLYYINEERYTHYI
jgi:hypothetical protein